MATQGGADADARDDDGSTPLHEAARRGDDSCVERLLAAGADPAARNNVRTLPSRAAPLSAVLLPAADASAARRSLTSSLMTCTTAEQCFDSAQSGDSAVVDAANDEARVPSRTCSLPPAQPQCLGCIAFAEGEVD